MPFSSSRRRFVSISLRNRQPAATMTMRTAAAAAATTRSVYTSDSGWFRTAATTAAPMQAMVVPNTSSISISTSMRRYGASKNLLLFQCKGQQLDTMHSFSKLPYSTSAPLAAIVEVETATSSESPVQACAEQQWREILFGGLLAVTLTATLVLGFPQTPAQADASPATAEATSTATNSNSKSISSAGSPHVTFLPTPKSTNSGNKNGGGSSGAVMQTTSKNSNIAQKIHRPASNSGRAPYDISVRAIRGGRMTMEDRFFVASGGKFVAVFDGHGGAGVSEYLEKHLYDNVCHYLELKHGQEGDESVNRHIPSVSSEAGALRAAFEKVESDVIADDALKYQGSTAVAVVVHEGEDGHRTIMSANVGDSRAILSRKGKAVDLTRDHKPSDEREKARILAMGEEIEWDNFSKVHRVRSLSLSRAIGDRYAKPAVSSEVEIRHFSVAEEGDNFVLLASDGLWDVMTSQEVVNFVQERLDGEFAHEQSQARERDQSEDEDLYLRDNMAKFVAREAIRRGSGDNVCVVLVFLNDAKTKQNTLS